MILAGVEVRSEGKISKMFDKSHTRQEDFEWQFELQIEVLPKLVACTLCLLLYSSSTWHFWQEAIFVFVYFLVTQTMCECVLLLFTDTYILCFMGKSAQENYNTQVAKIKLYTFW